PAGRTRTAGPEADTRSPRPAGRTRTAPEAGSDYRTPRPAGRTRTAGPEADTRSPRPDKRTRTAAPETPKVRAPRPPAQRRPPRAPGANDERLQKILAAAGIDSRRACEEIILEGRVQINGVTVTELGTKADPRRDEITVDLIPIQREAPVYILMNKPKGYVTTVKDDQGRPTVMALLKDVAGRVYPVGRLDYNSEGLLLMTNDGALAQILMGPEHEVPKVYLVKVHRTPKPELLREFQEGFLLSGRRLKPCHIEIAEKGDNPWLKVTLTEGKNQQIRRMFAAVGHPVSKLRRVQFGPLADPLLKPGTWRYLSPQEITAIKSL
ncbi:MAG: pseudouridine synthase, partial [Holophagaceae bacterium]